MEDLRIDRDRFRRDFDHLAEIGSTGDGGVNRPALGEAHLEARAWFLERIRADGLEPRVDEAGNHGARLAAATTEAPTLLLGSHLDSVPRGGRFDGALGVLAAYEVLRSVRDAGIELPVHLEAIDFTDEEGTHVPLMGSRALAGSVTREELERPRGDRDAFHAGLERAGLDIDGILQAARSPEDLCGFLELHIEQGPRLIDADAGLGVVSSIVGIGGFEAVFAGRADHAGTTPREARRDAGLGAATLVLAADELARSGPRDRVVNVGRLTLAPGAHNIVPAEARVGLEIRAADEAGLRELESALRTRAREAADRHGLELFTTPLGEVPPTPCDPGMRGALARAADSLGLRWLELTSGAGHDTMVLGRLCPAAMCFIPSTGGSHSPREFAEWEACVAGAEVLLRATVDRARAAAPSA